MAVPTAPYWSGVALPGADGIRIPTEVYCSKGAGNFGGVLALSKETDFDVAAANTTRGVSSVVTLLPAECMSSLITFNNSSANNINFALPAVFPGQEYILQNRCGNNITFLVTGKTGVTVANNVTQGVVCSSLAGDVIATGNTHAGG